MDYSVPPPGETLLDHAVAMGRRVFSIGKIDDIFAHRGITDRKKAAGNDALFDATLEALGEAGAGDLVFANFIDFDQLYGHRRDVAGYAGCLEAFDRRIPELEALLQPGDFTVLTADHGNDPTWTGTDHTRENVPVLAFGPGLEARNAGRMHTFADVGQTLSGHLALPPMRAGASFI
jgi:phosphopentomutase